MTADGQLWTKTRRNSSKFPPEVPGLKRVRHTVTEAEREKKEGGWKKRTHVVTNSITPLSFRRAGVEKQREVGWTTAQEGTWPADWGCGQGNWIAGLGGRQSGRRLKSHRQVINCISSARANIIGRAKIEEMMRREKKKGTSRLAILLLLNVKDESVKLIIIIIKEIVLLWSQSLIQTAKPIRQDYFDLNKLSWVNVGCA